MRALLVAAGGELDDLTIAFAGMLVRETEGNPFFVGEVLLHLVETNVIVQRDGHWVGTVTSLEEVGIPEGVRDVVGRRLSRLPEDANATLRTAAVVGREFPVDLVAEVAGVPEDVVLGHVELGDRSAAGRRGQRCARTHELLPCARALHARRRAEHDPAGTAPRPDRSGARGARRRLGCRARAPFCRGRRDRRRRQGPRACAARRRRGAGARGLRRDRALLRPRAGRSRRGRGRRSDPCRAPHRTWLRQAPGRRTRPPDAPTPWRAPRRRAR